jgi:hypothetical protein
MSGRHLVPTIERVLDSLSIAGQQVDLGRIELDLGVLTWPFTEDELCHVLGRELSRAIAGRLLALPTAAGTAPRIRSEEQAAIEIVQHYLWCGYLPSWAGRPASFALEAQLFPALKNQPDCLYAILQALEPPASARAQRALSRLVCQLGEAGLLRLLRQLLPNEAEIIWAYLDGLRILSREADLAAILPLSQPQLSHELWRTAVASVLFGRSAALDLNRLLVELLQALLRVAVPPAHVDSDVPSHLDYWGLLTRLQRAMRSLSANHPLRTTLSQLWAADKEAIFRAQRQQFWRQRARMPKSEAEAVIAVLDFGLAQGAELRDLPADWFATLSDFVQQQPRAASDFLRTRLRRPWVLAVFVRRSSPALLLRVMQVLHPTASALFTALTATYRRSLALSPETEIGARLREGMLRELLTLAPRTSVPAHSVQRVLDLLLASAHATDRAQQQALRLALQQTLKQQPWPYDIPSLQALTPDSHARISPAWDASEVATQTGAAPNPKSDREPDFDQGLASDLAQAVGEEPDQAWSEDQSTDSGKDWSEDQREDQSTDSGEAWGHDQMPGADLILGLEPEALLNAPGHKQVSPTSGPDSPARFSEHPTETEEAARQTALALLFPAADRAANDDAGTPGPAVPSQAQPASTGTHDRLIAMLSHASPTLVRLLRLNLRDARVRQHWLTHLPDPVLRRLLVLCLSDCEPSVVPLCELWPTAWASLSGSTPLGATAEKSLWGIAFSQAARLLAVTDPSPDPALRIRESLVAFATHLRANLSEPPDDWARLGASLVAAAQQELAATGQSVLAHALDRIKPDLQRVWQRTADLSWPTPLAEDQPPLTRSSQRPAIAPTAVPSPSPSAPAPGLPPTRPTTSAAGRPTTGPAAGGPATAGLRGRTAFSLPGEPQPLATGQALYVDNAGLVLTAPFLPHLFRSLDLLAVSESGRTQLRDEVAVSRAVHLLQYLATGRSHTPEPVLVLNKILCGVPIETVVAPGIEISEPEQTLCDFLLRSLIQQWTSIRGTSIAGLRETFLQREGKLVLLEDGWRLTVSRKTLDVLIDQVPWGFAVISHAWMRQPFFVTW